MKIVENQLAIKLGNAQHTALFRHTDIVGMIAGNCVGGNRNA
jgi:hypothetical protein